MEYRSMNRLRTIRDSQGIKQTRLAELSGVSQGDISRIENGYMPAAAARRRIAAALGVEVRDIWPELVREVAA